MRKDHILPFFGGFFLVIGVIILLKHLFGTGQSSWFAGIGFLFAGFVLTVLTKSKRTH